MLLAAPRPPGDPTSASNRGPCSVRRSRPGSGSRTSTASSLWLSKKRNDASSVLRRTASTPGGACRVGLTPACSHTVWRSSLDVPFLGACPQVVRRAPAERVAGYGWRARVEAFRVGGQGFCPSRVNEIGPQVALESSVLRRIDAVRLSGCHRDEVLDEKAEQFPERGRVSAEADVIVARLLSPRRTTSAACRLRPRTCRMFSCRVVGDEVQVRGDDELVRREIRIRDGRSLRGCLPRRVARRRSRRLRAA